ncbi:MULTISPECIES: S8 family serine peptidase [unclassified Crossiella]|uniref:S8 family serine peptidase n=1 Tax=unclassified Crossiella TaxID=2620835 RepID=UPI001FFF018F|nr:MULTISPECIES: S8 family serine peptidase [unclassified Crossiella]MCK2239050.1 S8 family serine peptidase [Crossiella sp. S99.2]MCK2251381.1 S8 family serine peptidase [Crossiella sp. S99.1]
MSNPPRQAAAPDHTGKGVVVGVVDSGIDVHHAAFRTSPTGPTRIVRLLDQVITTRQTLGRDGPVAPGSTVRISWTVPGAATGFRTDVLTFPLTKETLQAQLIQPGRIPAADVQVSGGPFPDQALVIDFIGIYAAATFDPYSLDSIGVQPGGSNWTPTIKFGREYTQQEINTALTGAVDPFYSRDGGSGHGSHVMGIAAGNSVELDDSSSADTVVGIAKQAELVAVRTSLGDDNEIVEAIRFILDQPWRAPGSTAKPAVANLSIGGSDGPHDGTSRLELELDKLVANTKGRVIVVAAGNEAAKVEDDDLYRKSTPQPRGGMHTVGTVPAGTENKHTIIVPDNHTQLLELHVWYSGPGRISLDLAVPLPGGAAGRFPGFGPTLATPILPGTGPDPLDGKFPDPPPVAVNLAGHAVQASSTINNLPSGKRHIWLKVRPRANGTVLPGNWLLVLRQLENASTPYHVWGMYTGQDRHFLFEFDKQDPTTTVENPGTAHNVITVGAYHGPTGTRGEFSGRGPTTDVRPTPKPDVSAPGIAILSARAGARGKGKERYVEQSGSSQAAPYVTGVVALMLEANGNLGHDKIAQFLRETCDKPDGVPDPPPPDSGWGAGKVNAEKAVAKAKASIGATLTADEPLVLPTAAYVTAQEPVTELLAALRARVEHTEAGRLLGKLIGTHAPEIQRLIHLHRRLLVAWLRLHGPQLVRLALHSEQCHRIPIPARLGGKPVAAGLARLLDELIPFAGPELRADIAQYREFVLAVPGVPADDYDQLPRNEA